MVRIFTFTRVAEPESVFPRVADLIGEYAKVAEKEGIRLLIENEASQNAGTAAETAKLLKLLPRNVGVNWDSLDGVPLGEKSFPDGYETLPKDRIWNVHVKGKSPARLSRSPGLAGYSERAGTRRVSPAAWNWRRISSARHKSRRRTLR